MRGPRGGGESQREPIERVEGVSRLQLRVGAVLVLGVLVAGCATAYSRGADAFRAGRYDEAAREFEAAVEAGTKRLEAAVLDNLPRPLLPAAPVMRAVSHNGSSFGLPQRERA